MLLTVSDSLEFIGFLESLFEDLSDLGPSLDDLAGAVDKFTVSRPMIAYPNGTSFIKSVYVTLHGLHY
jgi:hypothetical protein